MKLLLIFVSLISGITQQLLIIDEELQSFRREYRIFRASSIKLADCSYFQLYNAVNSTIFQMIEPFSESISKWKRVCKAYDKKHLNKDIVKKFTEICYDGKNVMQKLTFEHTKSLTTMFSGELMSISPSQLVAEAFLKKVELQMDEVSSIYFRNKSCARNYLGDFFISFQKGFGTIDLINDQAIFYLTRILVNVQTFSGIAKQEVEKCMKRIESCSQARNQQGCLKLQITKYIRFKNCASAIKLVHRVLHLIPKKVKRFVKYYERKNFESLNTHIETSVMENLRKC